MVAVSGLLLSGCAAELGSAEDDSAIATASAPLDRLANEPVQVVNPKWQLKLPSADDFTRISAGGYHTCAMKWNGTVYCWGRNEKGQAGVASNSLCSGVACVDRPTLVNGLSQAQSVDAGFDHTCALDTSGGVHCWGSNDSWQIGNSNLVSQIPAGTRFTSVSAGWGSTCAASANGVYCWGSILSGRWGATLVPGTGAWPDSSYHDVSVGDRRACMRHTVYGSEQTECFDQNADIFSSHLYALSALDQAKPASISSNFGCADGPSGSVLCFGDNTYGQLGIGTSGGSTNSPQAVHAPAGVQLHGVSAGYGHTCALDGSGAAYCWGANGSGQLGNGTRVSSSVPVRALTDLTFRAITTGRNHTCAISTTNHIYCWGDAYFGQLGSAYPAGISTWVPLQAFDP